MPVPRVARTAGIIPSWRKLARSTERIWRGFAAAGHRGKAPPPISLDARAARKPIGVIVCVVGLLVATMWIGVAASIAYTHEHAVATARANGRNLMIALREKVGFVLQGLDEEMSLLAQRFQREGADFDLYRWGRENVLVAPDVANATLIGPDGKVAATTLAPDAKPTDLSDRQHFRVFLGANAPPVYVGQSVIGRDSGKLLLPIARRVNAEDGAFLGVLVVLIDPHALASLHTSMDLGPLGVIALTGTDGLIRARYTLDRLDGTTGVGSSIAGGPWPGTIAENGEGGFERKSVVDGTTRLYAYGRIGSYPLVVTVGLDIDRELALAHSHARTIAILALAATVLLAGLAAYLIHECRIRMARETDLAAERNKLQHANDALVEAKNRAEAASRAKSLFLANMSHELRTPLNAIIGYSQMIRDQTFGPEAGDRYREYAGDVVQSGEQLLGLMTDMLDTAKIEAGKLEIEQEAVRVRDIVERSLDQLRLAIERKRIRLKVDLPGDLPPLCGDQRRLTQVLTNVLSNAVKFTPEHGQVSIAAECGAAGLICSISDTGIGMSADEIAVALEPFSQVDNSLAKNYEGTGLGLPLAKRLVELHGGTLEVESEKGRGTTIRLRLPPERVLPPEPDSAARYDREIAAALV